MNEVYPDLARSGRVMPHVPEPPGLGFGNFESGDDAGFYAPDAVSVTAEGAKRYLDRGEGRRRALLHFGPADRGDFIPSC